MSFFKRLFGKKEKPPAEEAAPPEEVAVEAPPVAQAPLDHFAIITTPAPEPVAEEEPLAEPQPTVESPALTADDLTFTAEPEEDPEPEPEEETFLEEPAATEEEPTPAIEAPDPEPAGAITVARLDEAEVLDALERALDELGSAHHRPFSRG